MLGADEADDIRERLGPRMMGTRAAVRAASAAGRGRLGPGLGGEGGAGGSAFELLRLVLLWAGLLGGDVGARCGTTSLFGRRGWWLGHAERGKCGRSHQHGAVHGAWGRGIGVW